MSPKFSDGLSSLQSALLFSNAATWRQGHDMGSISNETLSNSLREILSRSQKNFAIHMIQMPSESHGPKEIGTIFWCLVTNA